MYTNLITVSRAFQLRQVRIKRDKVLLLVNCYLNIIVKGITRYGTTVLTSRDKISEDGGAVCVLGGEDSSFYTSRRTVPINGWVANMTANGRAPRLSRRVVHVILYQLTVMDNRSSAPTVSHTYIVTVYESTTLMIDV